MTSLPDVFLPYQQRFWQCVDAHALSAHEKSRRTGFTWTAGALATLTASAQRQAGGQDVLYVGYEREMTREFMGYVADWARTFQVAASEVEEFVLPDPDHPEKNLGAFRSKFASGFEVVALPSVARALRGKQGLVILDEAAFMDDLEGVLKAALALLMWGGKVVVISTHNGEQNRFNELVNDIRAGKHGADADVTRITFDEACAEGLAKRVFLKQGLPWSQEAEDAWRAKILGTYRDNADEELNVIPNPASGTYLPLALIEARSVPDVPVLRWRAPPGFAMWPEWTRIATVEDFCRREILPILEKLDPAEAHCFGKDFARIRDLSVDWFLAIGRDMIRRTRLVIELADVPHEQQRQILFFVVERLPRFRAGKIDATGSGSYIGEVAMQRFGEIVEPVQMTEPWYRENMPPWKAAIEDGMLTLPRDAEITDDLRMVKLVRGVARIPQHRLTDEGQQRHGDAAIASVLAYAASRAEYEAFGYEAAVPKVLQSRPDGRRWHDRAPDDRDDGPPDRGWMPNLRGFA